MKSIFLFFSFYFQLLKLFILVVRLQSCWIYHSYNHTNSSTFNIEFKDFTEQFIAPIDSTPCPCIKYNMCRSNAFVTNFLYECDSFHSETTNMSIWNGYLKTWTNFIFLPLFHFDVCQNVFRSIPSSYSSPPSWCFQFCAIFLMLQKYSYNSIIFNFHSNNLSNEVIIWRKSSIRKSNNGLIHGVARKIKKNKSL